VGKRADKLRFKGEYIERKNDDGDVIVSGFAQSFAGIPTRDLDKSDIDALTDEQYRDATESGLYVAPAARTSSSTSSSKRKRTSGVTSRASAPAASEEPSGSDETAGAGSE
jgi:hypothetical protein